jgi:hypothetical protein
VIAIIRALPFVLIVSMSSSSVCAQQLTCYPIQRGDTAARLAQRLTGDLHNRHQPWFQIVDPMTDRFVPKPAYGRIQSGWQVCVATDRLRASLLRPPGYRAVPTSGVLVQNAFATTRPAIEPDLLLWLAPFVVFFFVGAAIAWGVAGRHRGERRVTAAVMRGFGARFVGEFERPLFRKRAAERALQCRLRLSPYRRKLEILLAPAPGRTYPNLADHRKNVEYDVERVLRVLEDRQFVHGPLHAEGEWVVIPFRMKRDVRQEGVQ